MSVTYQPITVQITPSPPVHDGFQPFTYSDGGVWRLSSVAAVPPYSYFLTSIPPTRHAPWESAIDAPPVIHISGFGEPLAHPDSLDLVRMAKDTGAAAEATTSGMLLDREMCQAIMYQNLTGMWFGWGNGKPLLAKTVWINSPTEADSVETPTAEAVC